MRTFKTSVNLCALSRRLELEASGLKMGPRGVRVCVCGGGGGGRGGG